MSILQYSSAKHGKVVIITIGGRLDAETAPNFNKKLIGEISKGTNNIIINMENLSYIASAGLGVLISANESVRKKSGEIKISSMNDKIKKIFKLLGFLNLFQIFENDESAFESF